MTSYTIIMEMDNFSTVSWDEFSQVLQTLIQQINRASQAGFPTGPQVVFVVSGEQDDAGKLDAKVRQLAPELASLCGIKFIALPGGRYYALKNAGIQVADGDVVIFLDSDTIAEPDWLCAMLTPFRNAGTIAVNGYTYLGLSDLLSRSFALIWFFPLREGDESMAKRRPLNANNCAFRRDWLAAHPFPIEDGFKVGCTLLMDELNKAGVTLERTPAYAQHLPLRGWRFLGWRALVTGRDADRKYELLKHQSRICRLGHAVCRSVTNYLRVLRRGMTQYSRVGLKLWHTPFVLMLGWVFYSLAFIAQAARALGLTRDKPEYIPATVDHS